MRARLLRIEDTRRDEPAYLDSVLAAPDANDRAAGALTAGRIGARRHAARLRELAGDADTAVAANALFSLGLLKDSSAVSVATSSLRARGPQAIEAAWLLGELGERGRDGIVAGLADASLSGSVRGAVLLASARLRPVPARAVVPLLASPDSAIAWRAAYVIARGRAAAAARALLSQGASPWASVREQVARGAAAGIVGDSLAEFAANVLATLVTDTSAHVRINALRSIASFGSRQRSAVVLALEDRDLNVRLVAAQSLDLVLDSTDVAWASAFRADTNFVIQRAVADGAIKRGIDLGTRAGWRTSADWRRRAAAAELDASIPARSDIVSRLSAWMADADGRVRATAVGGLAQLANVAGVESIVRDRLRSALTDDDASVRAASLGALAHGARADDLAAALASYRLARTDAENDARLAFWGLADTVLARGTALPDSVERSLAALAPPADPLERIAASHIARFSSWNNGSGAAQPMSWYEERAREARGRDPVLRVETERGIMHLRLFVHDAPLTVFNMTTLAARGYFDAQRFHRVVPNFVVQGGDPRGDGNGGPGYAIRDELGRHRYLRGTLGMALSGPNTGGSQFFITHSPQPHLDGGYTVFGQLLDGADVLDRLIQGDRIVRVTVQ